MLFIINSLKCRYLNKISNLSKGFILLPERIKYVWKCNQWLVALNGLLNRPHMLRKAGNAADQTLFITLTSSICVTNSQAII